MPKTLIISDFKVRCLSIIDEVAATGKPVFISRRGKPLARVCPLERNKPRQLGVFQGEVAITGDIVSADFSHDWEALQ
jgi:prevent-host-death family protein